MRNCPNSPRVPLKRQDLIALNKRSNLRPATLHHYERRIDETLFFIQRAFGAKLVGSLRRDRPLKIQEKQRVRQQMLARNWHDDAISPELGSFCQKSHLDCRLN
jgi:hypothetical protein